MAVEDKMKKQDLINLVRYHTEKNDEAFASEVAKMAKEFDDNGDEAVAQYLMELVSSANFYQQANRSVEVPVLWRAGIRKNRDCVPNCSHSEPGNFVCSL